MGERVGEALLRAVRQAVEETGVPVTTDDVIARMRLERAVDVEARKLTCCDCGGFDWDDL